MSPGSIARRYAKALLSLGIDAGQYEKWGQEVADLARVVEDPALADVLANPTYAASKREAIMRELVDRLQPSKTVGNFVMLLVERDRIDKLPDISREYQVLCDKQANRLRASVVSARPLTPTTSDQIKTALQQRTGKQVILTKETDESLIAGVVTTIGSVVYDGSVRTRLEQMRQTLSGSR